MLSKLEGDFVFAIWDPRSEELLCARDQLGVKHFYYYHEPERRLRWRPKLKHCCRCLAIRGELNEQAIGDYLVFNFQDKVSTFYKGIYRLPATHAMSISLKSSKPRIWRYWSPEGISPLSFEAIRIITKHFERNS